MRIFRGFVRLCAILGAVMLLGSYLGAVHPLGDSLAVFRVWIAGGVAGAGLVLLLVGSRKVGWATTIFAAVALAPIFSALSTATAAPEASSLTIYTKNVLGGWGDNDAIIADILASEADIVMLQEMSTRRGDFVGALRETHPHRHLCRFSDWSGMAVLSRWPLEEGYCSPYRSFAAARVAHPDGPIWAVSTHLVWPYPHEQAVALDYALPFLNTIEGRAVVAGDFNMAPWGHSVGQIASATGTRRIGQVFTTIEVRNLPMTIDHVLTDGLGTTERRPRFGSDHYGIVAHIGWPDA